VSEEQQNDQDLAQQVYEPPEEFAKNANIQDPEIWDKAAEDYEGFWESWARELHWFEEWDQVHNWDPPFTQWFVGGKINASYNCLDRHIEDGKGDKQALIWVGDEPDQGKTYTYNELLAEVNKFANVLKDLGIGKGDTVSIYLPMIPELPIAMLACARIGAIHAVVFSAFQPGQLSERINDVESTVLITADQSPRGGQITPLKENADEALQDTQSVEHVVVVRRTGEDVPMEEGRDQYWDELVRRCERRVRGRADGRRGPVLRALLVGLDGQAQGHPAQHRRLPGAAQGDHDVDYGPEGRRRLLVHGGHRLDHRPLLPRLRSPGLGCDDAAVRGNTDLPRTTPAGPA
jgi:acetyl-CoA synthetase